MTAFAGWLKAWRRGQGWTQQELAEQAGYSLETIVKIETGARRPSRGVAERLAGLCTVLPAAHAAFVHAARAGLAPALPGASPPSANGGPLAAVRLYPPLPAPPNAFIGRAQEVAALTALLTREGVRLVTVLGPPGVGKTRLALAVAEALDGMFAHGVAWVPLAPVPDPALVGAALATALGVRDPPPGAPAAGLAAALRGRNVLLVLDNFEQVLPAGGLVAELLAHAPQLRILITSRAPLHIYGERRFLLDPLPLPAPPPAPPSPAALRQLRANPSVAFFLDRVEAAAPGFRLTRESAPAVAALCVQLDGLPLALELAAPRLRQFTPADLLARLAARGDASEDGPPVLQLLADGPRDLPPRQQTIRAAIDWSYDLLPPAQQALFRRLSVLAGGGTEEAAWAIAGWGLDGRGAGGAVGGRAPMVEPSPLANPPALAPTSGAPAAAPVLNTLVDQSLLQVARNRPSPRYELLETIREYGWVQTVAMGEGGRVQARHGAYYVALAEAGARALRGPDQISWLARLEAERANGRAALAWAAGSGRRTLLLRLVVAWGSFWLVRGPYSEGRAWLERAVVQYQDTRSPRLAPVLLLAGLLAVRQGDCAMAEGWLERARLLYEQACERAGVVAALAGLGALALRRADYAAAAAYYAASLDETAQQTDPLSVADAYAGQGEAARCQGHYGRAAALYRQALARYRAAGDVGGVARLLVDLGNATLADGDTATAGAAYSESLGLLDQLGDPWGRARALNNLGELARHAGRYAEASARYQQALDLMLAAGSPAGTAWVYSNLGLVALAGEDAAAAAGWYRASLAQGAAMGDKSLIAIGLAGLAGVAAVTGDPQRAARLFAGAEVLTATLGASTRALAGDQMAHDTQLAAAQAQLTPAVWAAAWATGLALSPDEAVAYALEPTEAQAKPLTDSA